jgi:hypothetical protein
LAAKSSDRVFRFERSMLTYRLMKDVATPA